MKRLIVIVIALLSIVSSTWAQDAALCTAGDFEFYLDKGRSAVGIENYDLALTYLRCAIELEPDNTQALEERGAVYLTLEDYENALADYQQIVDADPENANALFRLAYSQQETGSYREAVETYSRYIELEPNDSSGFNNRGVGYYSLERYDEAMDDYSRALELDPENIFALTNRANVFMDREEYDLALADMNRALDVEDDADHYLTRAVIYERMGLSDEAVADFWTWVNRIELEPIDEDFEIGSPITLSMEEGVVYYLPFEAEFGQVVSATAVGQADAGASIDPLLLILNADREPVAANDDGAGGLDALIDGYSFPEAGRYYLVVAHAGGGFEGSITLTSDIQPGLTAGQDVIVRTTKDDYLNLREGAGLDFDVIERLPDGTYATTLEGPVSADGYVWWRVSAAGDTVEGWVALSADGERTLVLREP